MTRLAKRAGILRIVVNQNGRRLSARNQTGDQRLKVTNHGAIQQDKGFVQQKQLRIDQQGASQTQSAVDAARQMERPSRAETRNPHSLQYPAPS
jgi:hypothetical protein